MLSREFDWLCCVCCPDRLRVDVAGLQAQNGHGKQGNTHKSWFAIPFMHGDDGAPNKDEKSSWFGGGAGGRQQTGARDKADGWFGWGGSDTKKEEKHWADWMPSYKHGDTREKKAKVVKAATFGKDHDVAAAALEYKVAKTNNQIHDFLHGKPKKKEWWDFGTNSEAQRKKPGQCAPKLASGHLLRWCSPCLTHALFVGRTFPWQESTTGPGSRDQQSTTPNSSKRTSPCPGRCGVGPRRALASAESQRKRSISRMAAWARAILRIHRIL